MALTTIAAAATVAGQATAQIPLTPRALGMGGAYVATARGFESVLFNPANLGLGDTPDWSASLPQITIGSSVLGPDVSDLPDFFNFDDLEEARKQELLGTIPETGTSVDLVVRAPVAALQVGRLGFAASYAWIGEHTVGKDLVELFFEGYDQGRSDYQVGNTVGTRGSFWDLAAGYGQQVGPVALGVTGHFYLNGTLMRSRAFEPVYGDGLLTPLVRVEYAGVYSRGGTGYGLDIGAAMQPMFGVTVSAALANVVGGFDWSDELVGRSVTLTESDFQNGDFTSIEDRWSQSEKPVSEFSGRSRERVDSVGGNLNPGAWTVPTTLKLGAAWAPIAGTEIGAAYHASRADDGEGLLGGKWDGLLGLGVQHRLPFVTVRLGASTDGSDGSMIGGGIKLGVLDLGLARFSTADPLSDADRDGWAASMSVNVRTQGSIR